MASTMKDTVDRPTRQKLLRRRTHAPHVRHVDGLTRASTRKALRSGKAGFITPPDFNLRARTRRKGGDGKPDPLGPARDKDPQPRRAQYVRALGAMYSTSFDSV